LELSFTCTVNVGAPAAVGVPLMTPAADKVSPAGNVPEATDHVYPPVPPVAVSVWLYPVPTVPFGSDPVAIVKGAAVTVMLSALLAVVCELSFT
jgi:hypothetical protein